jgi:transcriptional regulator
MGRVYIPSYFEPPDDESVRSLLLEHGAADLITVTEQGLLATLLPLIYLPPAEGDPARPLGALIGHVARNNDQWRLPAIGEALAIVRGEDAYITPSWYAAKAEHGRVVPTWNYVTVHVYGELIVHDDPDWVESMVRGLTAEHEGRRAQAWSVDDAPAQYIQGQLRAIVGLELLISRVEAKYKLNQNRSADDVRGVVTGLAEAGRAGFAEQTERASAAKLAGESAQLPS